MAGLVVKQEIGSKVTTFTLPFATTIPSGLKKVLATPYRVFTLKHIGGKTGEVYTPNPDGKSNYIRFSCRNDSGEANISKACTLPHINKTKGFKDIHPLLSSGAFHCSDRADTKSTTGTLLLQNSSTIKKGS